MPESILDQINAAIRNSEDTSERAMLLVMLQLYNLWKENADELAKMNSSLETIARAHDGIDPDDHLDHHGWVRIEKAEAEIRAKESRDIRAGVLKQVLGSGLWWFLMFIAGAVSTKVFGG